MQELLQSMVEEYGDRIYRLALRYSGDPEQAEDLAQETFLQAFKHLDRFDRSRKAGPWLFKIATNLCRNWLRSRREEPVEDIEEYANLQETGPEYLYLRKEREEELFIALQSLPQIYREVILLRHVGELSYGEISQTLDLDLTLVKNRLYRGRVILKELLDREGVHK